jgi:hypothetical protein
VERPAEINVVILTRRATPLMTPHPSPTIARLEPRSCCWPGLTLRSGPDGIPLGKPGLRPDRGGFASRSGSINMRG